MKMNPNGAEVPSGAHQTVQNSVGSLASDRGMPKDGRSMVAILKDMGISDFEPRVVNQLLEFSFRYISTILEDSKLLSAHARKKTIDLEDVKLAVQMHADHNLSSPPSRDILLEVAAKKNAISLPIPKTAGGLHMPPDRYCLTACNYKLRSGKKTRGRATGSMGGGSKSLAPKVVGPSSQAAFSVKSMANNSGISTPPASSASGATLHLASQPTQPLFQVSPLVSADGQSSTPVFSMTVNPETMTGNHSSVVTGIKRKAEDESVQS